MIVRFSTSDNLDLKTKAYRDLKWISIVTAISLVLAVYFDVLDVFVHWYITEKEPYELEEIIPVFLVLPFAMAFFSWRRWQDLLSEIKKRKRAEEMLRVEKESLQRALSKIRTLSGLLPICSSCKKIRDDKGYWHQVEMYIRDHSEADFSHSICPECAEKLYSEYIGEA